MQHSRLTQQIQFIIEIDKLKNILRQTLLTDGSRRENSAWINSITRDRLMHRVSPIADGAPALWSYVESLIDECVRAGYLN
jgi:hypothetical protein